MNPRVSTIRPRAMTTPYHIVNGDFTMIPMSAGELPSYDVFVALFDVACPDGVYRVRNCSVIGGDADYTAEQLWDDVTSMMNDYSKSLVSEGKADELFDWVSCVLHTLGIEWV